jgi:proteasome lid subunit RPN8/RPN11
VTAIRPEAHTTQGSFHVDPRAMARVVRAAANLGLQVVCQVHTHPGRAYHSDGDVEGARIRYAGFTSVVLPDYGRRLPRFDGAAIYMLGTDDCWVDLNPDELIIAPENAS